MLDAKSVEDMAKQRHERWQAQICCWVRAVKRLQLRPKNSATIWVHTIHGSLLYAASQTQSPAMRVVKGSEEQLLYTRMARDYVCNGAYSSGR